MSKPVPHDEVEDVLSSIRRLVSENKRPMAGLRAEEAARQAEGATDPDDASAAEGMDRGHFVLTPSLRVMEKQAGPDQADDGPLNLGAVALRTDLPPQAAPTNEDGAPEDPAEEGAAISDRPLRLDPAMRDMEAEAPHGDDAEFHGFDACAAAAEAAEEEQEIAFDAVDHHDADSFEADFFGGSSSDDSETDATPVATVAVDLEKEDDEAPFETADIDEDADPFGQPDTQDDELGNNTSAYGTISEGPTGQARSTWRLTAKIAALETAMGAIEQDFEPDGGEESQDLSPLEAAAMAWEDDIELDARGTPVPTKGAFDADEVAAAAFAAEENDDEDTAEDQLLDEAALRDLVGEIVRAELQGALGERITRNVRKLVRREIHRAMTAKEFE